MSSKRRLEFFSDIESGEQTCASRPGVFCKHLHVKRFGTVFVCMLFREQELSDEHGCPSGAGTLQRLPECLAAEKKQERDTSSMHPDPVPGQLDTTLPTSEYKRLRRIEEAADMYVHTLDKPREGIRGSMWDRWRMAAITSLRAALKGEG